MWNPGVATPEDIFLSKNTLDSLRSEVLRIFPPLQQKMFSERANGLSWQEIQRKLGLSDQALEANKKSFKRRLALLKERYS